MATGQIPFDGESAGEILMKHLTQPPNLAILPDRLRPVIGKALSKDPARRQRSAMEFLREFEAAVWVASLFALRARWPKWFHRPEKRADPRYTNPRPLSRSCRGLPSPLSPWSSWGEELAEWRIGFCRNRLRGLFSLSLLKWAGWTPREAGRNTGEDQAGRQSQFLPCE